MMRNILLYGSIAILFTVTGAYFNIHRLKSETPQTNATINLFTQSFPDAHGKIHNISQWKGKLLVVNFWATWCAPCVQEMPELSALQAEKFSKNVQIIGIGIDSSANISEFELKYKIAYPLYVAGVSGTDLLHRFGNQTGGLPFTVLIGRDGRFKKAYLGRLKMDELRQDLASF
jgi:thiol-disulfide isomerase/thioredoxin